MKRAHILDINWPVVVTSFRNGTYLVTYGKQEDKCKSYSEACQKVGEAVMHSLTCEGMLEAPRDEL